MPPNQEWRKKIGHTGSHKAGRNAEMQVLQLNASRNQEHPRHKRTRRDKIIHKIDAGTSDGGDERMEEVKKED